MKTTLFLLAFLLAWPCFGPAQECHNVVMANWRYSAVNKSLQLVNFAPKAVSYCQIKQEHAYIMETRKGDLLYRHSLNLPELPRGESVKETQIDLYFEAPIPVWAKKAQLSLKEATSDEIIATGEMR
jgi:hypothetical protein